MNKEPKAPKKGRCGRWSKAEVDLFEELLQRHGKNWKKIQEYMKNRSLCQIRSHAQKFFSKIGHKKVEQYQRKAKLIQAYDTLQKEKRLQKQEQPVASDSQSSRQEENINKKEQFSQEGPQVEEQSLTCLQSSGKEVPRNESLKVENKEEKKVVSHGAFGNFLYPIHPITNQNGFLMHLIGLHPNSFSEYGLGLENYRSHQSSQHNLYFPGYQQ